MIFQEPMTSLSPLHTVGGQITEALYLYRDVDKQTGNELAAEMLHLVGFPDPTRALKTYPFELSGGLRERIGIARALLKRADIMVLNESTSALDPAAQDRITAKVLEARDGQGAIWVVNRASMASQFVRVAVLSDGQMAQEGTYEELNKDGTALHELLQSS